MEEKKEWKRPDEFVEIGTLWLEVHHGVRVEKGKMQALIMPADKAIPQYRVITSSFDPKTGYGVFVVTSEEKYSKLQRTVKALLGCLRSAKMCFDAAMSNMLKSAEGGDEKKDDDDDDDAIKL